MIAGWVLVFGLVWMVWAVGSELIKAQRAKAAGFKSLQDYYNALMQNAHPMHQVAVDLHL